MIPVIERMDYLSYYFNAMAFCGAVETLLECEVPKRAQYLRVIHLELNRIMSHLVWLGTSALDLGAISMFWYCFRERETDPRPLRVLLRPADAHALLPGRRRDRGHPARLRGEAARVHQGHAGPRRPVRATSCAATRSCCSACAASARSTRQTLLALGVTGPLLRAAGNPWDLRKAAPYAQLRGLRLQDPGRHGRRQLRPLRGAPGRDLRVGEDHRAGARRAARGAAHHRPTARSRCRRATSWRPRWRR